MTYPRMTHYMAAFLRRKWKNCKAWPNASLLAWVQWFVDNNRYLLVSENKRIISLGLYRRVKNAEDLERAYADDGGPIIYIDVLCSNGGRGLKGSFNSLLRKEGDTATHVSWIRGKCRDRFSLFTLGNAARHLVLTS